MKGERLPGKDGEVIDRKKEVTIYFEGKSLKALEGDTVASALHANGVRVFARSFKYHRPRGLLCLSGDCPNCMVNVNGVPHVRACTEPVREGLKVNRQNAWPSADHDVLSILERLGRFMPVGFYYKKFVRTWPLVRPIVRRITGFGEVDWRSSPEPEGEHVSMYADVAVVGGGPAGISASLEAAGLGLRVILIDDQPSLGGHLRYQTKRFNSPGKFSGLRGFEIARKMEEEVERQDSIRLLKGATAFGLYEGNLLGIAQGKRMVKVRAKRIIVAAGCHERFGVFQRNDLPGIFLGRGVQRLMNFYGVKPGEKAVVVSNNDSGIDLSNELLEAGIKLQGVIESREELSDENLDSLRALEKRGATVLRPYFVKEALGTKQVKGLIAARLDGNGGFLPNTDVGLDCDFVCLSLGHEPAISLLHQGGCKFSYDLTLGEFVPSELPPTLYSAGEVNGFHSLPIIALQGRATMLQASLSLVDSPSARSLYEEVIQELHGLEVEYMKGWKLGGFPTAPNYGNKSFVCICEDVPEKELIRAIEEGFYDLETLKRYSTVTMGPCQGKVCHGLSIGICARETKRSIEETGMTTSRPPLRPVTLEVLAGKRKHPVKLTAMHENHVKLGATIMDMGDWKRPRFYSSVEGEWRAMRESVGLIDVSTLGKFAVKGKGAGKLLDFVYTSKFSNLPVGKVRYGVVCNEEGIVLDDGTVSRLAEDYYYITTSTGNAEFMEGWFKWWIAGTGMCAHIVNLTSAYAAINIAGPKAADMLSRLTDLDLTPSGFPYLAGKVGKLAGVPTLFISLGFVGERGWELHFPSEYGEYIWETLMEAGKEFGIGPAGVEAQRVLRLEKKHVIVGHDTDATSDPIGSDMPWVVKLDKPDFVGKRSLAKRASKEPERKLTGFVVSGSDFPEEGSIVTVDGKVVGHVTSSKYSPHLKKIVGMLWLPTAIVKDGQRIEIVSKGKFIAAEVFTKPFYDPEGKRMRT